MGDFRLGFAVTGVYLVHRGGLDGFE